VAPLLFPCPALVYGRCRFHKQRRKHTWHNADVNIHSWSLTTFHMFHQTETVHAQCTAHTNVPLQQLERISAVASPCQRTVTWIALRTFSQCLYKYFRSSLSNTLLHKPTTDLHLLSYNQLSSPKPGDHLHQSLNHTNHGTNVEQHASNHANPPTEQLHCILEQHCGRQQFRHLVSTHHTRLQCGTCKALPHRTRLDRAG
jgi:hypothetical protein